MLPQSHQPTQSQQWPGAIPTTKLTLVFSIGRQRADCSGTHTAKELGQIRPALMQEEVPSPTLNAGGGLCNLSGQNLAGVLKAGALKESVLTIIMVSIAPNATSVFT